VWTDPVSQERRRARRARRALRHTHPGVHAPTLLLTQRVWGADPWVKDGPVHRPRPGSGADTVVLHPPFRWQREYAEEFVDGVAERETQSGVRLAVENMFPWRARGRETAGLPPAWDPVSMAYDTSRSTSRTPRRPAPTPCDGRRLGPRLRHIHLADGSAGPKDEHLVPGRGGQPCAEVLDRLAEVDFDGTWSSRSAPANAITDEPRADLRRFRWPSRAFTSARRLTAGNRRLIRDGAADPRRTEWS
jgi:hypothetical protein